MKPLHVIAFVVASSLLARAPAAASQPEGFPPHRTADCDEMLPGIIPEPRLAEFGACEAYELPASLSIAASGDGAADVASVLASDLRDAGVAAKVVDGADATAPVRLSEDAGDPRLGAEGYTLSVSTDGIAVRANAAAGLFYGVQTLAQLLPASPSAGRRVPAVRITDWPQYRWRGVHLDVSRHFFPVPVVERYIDVVARYKLNVFHWHLTDDQGWRIEIRGYPRLTEVGGCRAGSQSGGEGSTQTDGVRYCGYYTQDQIRQVVAYATARFVTVVPEIDMPGHSQAAVAAYPWLGCDGAQHPVRELWGVSTYVLCPTERTFAFVDDEIGQVAALFPGPYIHIGGDEVPADAWRASPAVMALRAREHLASSAAVQGYFTKRVAEIVRGHGKRVIGWDDIMAGGVPSGGAVMVWNDLSAGAAAAKQGLDAVINPDPTLYFDQAQGSQTYEPLSIGGLTTLQMVYDFDPMPSGLTPEEQRHILGAQGDVWAEYIPTSDRLFYMLLPRALALAEICWTPRDAMDWASFASRLGAHLTWLEAHGYHYRIPGVTFTASGDVTFPEQEPDANVTSISIRGPAPIALSEIASGATIHYTLDGTTPSATSPVYGAPILAAGAGSTLIIAAIAVLPDGRASTPAFLRVTVAR